ncbi:hypothetical protein ACHAQJ_001230 [Trichoderma viride]
MNSPDGLKGSRTYQIYPVQRPEIPLLALIFHARDVSAPEIYTWIDTANCTYRDGVNDASYDSTESVKQIIKHGIDNLESAVVDYEKAMLPRAIKAIEKGHWFTQHFLELMRLKISFMLPAHSESNFKEVKVLGE